MKRFSNRKLRIKMQLKIFKYGKVIHSSTKQKKSAVFKEIKAFQSQKPDKWGIRVVYGKGMLADGKIDEIENAGEYESIEDLTYALQLFTEKPLIDETEIWISESQ